MSKIYISCLLIAVALPNQLFAQQVELKDDFSQQGSWEFVDDGWRYDSIAEDNPVLSLHQKQSNYEPKVRSPRHLALLKKVSVSQFQMDVRVKSTHEDYNHRDVCLFFGYQSPTQFYYVHLGKKTDPHANQIFIVNNAARTKISLTTTEGTPWDEEWHHVRIVRDPAVGSIKVFFDDMDQPAMTANDKTFSWGRVGLGSFDDTADFDEFQLSGQSHKPSGDFELTGGEKVVFLGDSITQAGARKGGYVRLFESYVNDLFPNDPIKVVGAGISGNRVPNLEARLEKDVLSHQPDYVVIYIGINDVWHSLRGKGTSKQDYRDGLIRIIERIQESNGQVVLCTPTVIGEKTDGTNELDPMLEEYSTISRQVARETGATLLDLRKNFLNHLKRKNKKQEPKGILTRDSVHLTAAGNEFVAQRMISAFALNSDFHPPKSSFQPSRSEVYKTVGDVNLKVHIFEPENDRTNRPAIVFFFGGGWVGGTPEQFYPHCAHLAKQGFVAMAADYRVKSRNQTTPFECVKDGKSAIRWIRANAERLGVNPRSVLAGGGSAGGHVAAACGTIVGLEEGENLNQSSVPDAMVLFNPVYDNGPGGFGHKLFGDDYKLISPIDNLSAKTPPTIVFLGTRDKLIPVETAKRFQNTLADFDVKSELHLYTDKEHGFFNYDKEMGRNYRKSIEQLDSFLRDLGYYDTPKNQTSK